MQRILLVEDDSSIVRSLTAFLAEEGFSAASAPGERRARELLCEESFDLLLVDISLADGSGFGVCAAAKERGLPVIFLTAFGDEGSVATKGGNDLYLSALEYRLLLVFVNNRGKVLSRSKLLEEIWDVAGDFVNDNTLTVYIKRLREKIEDDPQSPQIIRTVRGMGYKVDG